MKLLLCLLSPALLLTAPFAQAQAPAGKAPPIDFRVSYGRDVALEGPERTRPLFSIGERRIAFREPQQCQMHGELNGVTIHLGNRGISGQITVTNSAFAPELDFNGEVARYHQTAEAALPAGAEKVEFKGASQQLYTNRERKSLSFEWLYTSYALRSHRQVAYINIDPQHQVCLTIVCDEKDWQAASGIAARFMSSWYFVDPKALEPVAASLVSR